MALSARPKITGPTLEYSPYTITINHKLQQLITWNNIVHTTINPIEAGKSQGKYPKHSSLIVNINY